ncbi:MAG TPA: GlsB/YeaQ/YmgE family stress response membrane protein, partial [Thermodesulfobacteriota bacterium]|nr:GlsB/YeaQ/YmgE family stress response membrane protein [Thermodesulfobacteriota bacterium]
MGFTEIISWIIFGLVAGAVAKLIMPGKDPGGFVVTIVIGIVGALVGGYAAKMFSIGQAVKPGYDLKSFAFAVGGSILLLIVYRVVK